MPDPTAELETRVRTGLADLVAGGPAPSSRHAAVYARAARHEQRFVQRRRLLAGTAAVAVVGGGTAWVLRRDGERHVAVGPAGSTDAAWGPIDVAPLSDRVDPAVVWAGDQLIVWGGVVAGGPDYLVHPDGAAWSPTSATWQSIADAPAGAIAGGFGLWDGREMLVGLIEGDPNAPSERSVQRAEPALRHRRLRPDRGYLALHRADPRRHRRAARLCPPGRPRAGRPARRGPCCAPRPGPRRRRRFHPVRGWGSTIRRSWSLRRLPLSRHVGRGLADRRR